MYFSNPKTSQQSSQILNNPPRTLQVCELNEEDCLHWDNFVNTQGDHLYHLTLWRKVFQDYFKLKAYYLYAKDETGIQAVLPLVEMKSFLFGHALMSLPFLVEGGPIGSEPGCLQLIEKAIILGEKLGVDYIDLKCVEPKVDLGWDVELYVNFKRSIDSDHEVNLKNIPRKQRAVIRKAEKAGLRFEFEQNVEQFYKLYAESVRNLGTPVLAKSYFDYVFKLLGENCSILTVYQEQQPLTSVMSFYHQQMVLPFYGGGNIFARKTKANDYMYWQLMKNAVERGIQEFNFGRSKIVTGSYSFKKNWGFEPKPMHYKIIPIKAKKPPNINPTNPKYQLMIKTWRKLPLWLSMSIGPIIARRIG